MRIGIYGGSFDPIHIGHAAMASYVAQYGDVDEVWLLVSPENPLKSGIIRTPGDLRLDMAREAIGDDPLVKVSDFEFSLPRPSYTLATLDALASAWPEHQFTLIIGADNWSAFHRWRDPDLIVRRYGLIIYPRRGFEPDYPLPQGVTYLSDAPLIEVSSTFIREGMMQGKDMRHFLPEGARRFILANNLYSLPSSRT